jgi:hypothetical protein
MVPPEQVWKPRPPASSLPQPKTSEPPTPPIEDPPLPELPAVAVAMCPPEMGLVAGVVCVDRWEASLVRVWPDGRRQPWSPFAKVVVAKRGLKAVSLPGVSPQGYISGKAAAQACRTAGKRLCGASEWEAACRGPNDTTYPYGEDRRAGACNDDGRSMHPVAEVTSRLRLPRERMWYEGMEHPLINQLPDTVSKTGERAACTNGYGMFDMVGNLHEWINDPEGTFRGGFYMDTFRNGEGCDYATGVHSIKYHDYSTGFRCCKDPEAIE